MNLSIVSTDNALDAFVKYAAANKIGHESLLTGTTICLLSLIESLNSEEDVPSQLYAAELMDIYLQIVEVRLHMRQNKKSGGIKVVK